MKFFATAMILAIAAASAPAGEVRDETLDWLLSRAATAPATRPADTQPAVPFERPGEDPEKRKGFILLSNNEKIPGTICTTREKPIRIWDPSAKQYVDVPWALIKSMEARVLWERDEKEWHFVESGSDIKEYSGKTYPARELEYVVTLVNGQTITGGIVAPLYVSGSGHTLTFVLYKRQKGDLGKTLKDLVYVKRVELE